METTIYVLISADLFEAGYGATVFENKEAARDQAERVADADGLVYDSETDSWGGTLTGQFLQMMYIHEARMKVLPLNPDTMNYDR